MLKEDLFLVGTQDCPGQSVDVNAIAKMNLFLPSDYSAIRLRVDEAFSLRRFTAKVIGEIESIATLTAAIASGMDVTHYHSFHESLFVIKFTRQSELIATGTGSERVVNVSD
ncbi:nitrogen assimilation transcriptional regulator [Shigella sonnei]|nr:nitrogen assimilation transcriptional regulator [Shigella sonnei]